MDSSRGDSKPCILHVFPTLGSGGAERQLLTVLSNPAMRASYRHIVALTEVAKLDPGNPKNHYAREFEKRGIEIVGLDRAGKLQLPACIRAIRRLIRERKVDLVHTQLLWSNIAGRIAGRLGGVPVVSSFQSTDYASAYFDAPLAVRLKLSVIRRLDGLTARHCQTHSVAVSESVSRHVQANLGLKPESITVIYNTFSLDQVTPTCDDPRGKVFGILGLPNESRLVLTVGRLGALKGHIELVRAMTDVFRKHDDVHLAIVGSRVIKPFYEKLCQMIDELGVASKVHLIEPRHDIADFLAAADVFAFPTKLEGFSLALMEAMAADLPCVVSDIAPNLEVVRHEETGLVVPVGDVGALAGAILRLLEDRDLAQRLGRAAKEFTHEKFRPDRWADALSQLYDDLLHRKPD